MRVAEVTDRIEGGITQLDAERAAGYAGLLTLRLAKDRALDRREKLYTAKYSARDSRVLRAQRERQLNARFQQEVSLAQTQAATPVPDIDANSYVLHGYVRNREREPQPKLTVALYDEKGQWLKTDDYCPTNENGYFRIRYHRTKPVEAKPREADVTASPGQKPTAPASATGKPEDDARLKTAKEKAMEAGPTDTKQQRSDLKPENENARDLEASAEREARAFEVRVYDARQNLLQREARPVTPRIGAIDYREILLADDACGVTPPPSGRDQPPAPPKTNQGPRENAPGKPAPRSVPAPAQTTPEQKKSPASTRPATAKATSPRRKKGR